MNPAVNYVIPKNPGSQVSASGMGWLPRFARLGGLVKLHFANPVYIPSFYLSFVGSVWLCGADPTYKTNLVYRPSNF